MLIQSGSALLQAAIENITDDLSKSPNLFKHYTSKDLSLYVSSLQQTLMKRISFKDRDTIPSKLEVLDKNAVKTFVAASKKGLTLYMRHAEQLKAPAIQKACDEDAKIVMMTEPHNTSDRMTLLSAFNFINHLVLFKFLKDKYGITVSVNTSENRRAFEPASALSSFLNESPPIINSALKCLSYPSPQTLSSQDLKKCLVNGKLPWKKESIDAVCGTQTYEILVGGVKTILKSTPPTKNHIQLYVSHTQQLKAASDILGKKSDSFEYFGYIGIDGAKNVLLNQNGLTKRQRPKAAPIPSPFKPCGGIHAMVFPSKHASTYMKP